MRSRVREHFSKAINFTKRMGRRFSGYWSSGDDLKENHLRVKLSLSWRCSDAALLRGTHTQKIAPLPIRTQRLRGFLCLRASRERGKDDKRRGPRNTTAHVSVQTRNAGPQKWNNGAETRAICWCQVEVPRRGRPATLLPRDVSIPRVHCGPRGAPRAADLCAPTPAGASFFSASHPPSTAREKDTSRCCVCLFVYVHFVILI